MGKKGTGLFNEQYRYFYAVAIIALAGMMVLVPSVHGAEKKPTNVFMWSVQGTGARVYILGSMHVLKESSYPLDQRIEKAYESCPRVVFEANPAEAGSDEVRGMMLKLGTCREGRTLHSEISPKTYDALRKRVLANGMKPEQFNTFRPWYAALVIASLELNRLGFLPEQGLDSHFYRKASSDKKEMIFLETARQQLDLLAKSFPGQEEDLLSQALEEMAVLEKISADMEKAWKAGDAEQMEAFTRKSLQGFPEVEKKLFTERNKAWTKRISKLLTEKGDVFMVVGAGHLVGKGGVIDMLRARGYTAVQQ